MSKEIELNSQSGILGPVPKHARYMMFALESDVVDVAEALQPLEDIVDGDLTIVGVGPSIISGLGKQIPNMRAFPALVGPGFDIPSTQYALWF